MLISNFNRKAREALETAVYGRPILEPEAARRAPASIWRREDLFPASTETPKARSENKRAEPAPNIDNQKPVNRLPEEPKKTEPKAINN